MKYMGSKARITKYIAPLIISALRPDTPYIEPFVGGGNSIAAIDHPIRVGYDTNKFVIALLSAIRDGWRPPDLQRDDYKDIQRNPHAYEDSLVGWAGVCCSYSGKWFGGYAGKVQTRAGVRDYIEEARRNCLRQATRLHGVRFAHSDYLDIEIPIGSVVYCDPPYRGTTNYGDEFDTDKFWIWCAEQSRFSKVFVSEYSAPAEWTPLWGATVGSSLSANGQHGGRKLSVEKLFTHKRNVVPA
ncbi:Site-specific DNA methylase [Mycobacteroides abscessus subsp. abscessus]|uniref:DNA adenine methylase n=1 Tax=Mycobacteroides abscessus TaxID=36809 RepID=UPI0009274D1E|nr:DNA adenine methylase [Mycobacteroides abscessus]QSM02924.1 DNA methyltransferase [Mycobacterium phage prophiGD05-1]MDM2350920.1 DNA adenine methylase [Mycobacteroides abscessus]MDM2357947.1 DNA adenine methylase [Mycobacteroides abscessus]QSN50774.1 DNA adenine methylase [Mycobacteroides abscessus subsp. abscessus]SII44095.1 Site-specific DNA methylase [Mycobacteroides abscessus subsp. abscessus]